MPCCTVTCHARAYHVVIVIAAAFDSTSQDENRSESFPHPSRRLLGG
jgi:hypothetical protein